MLTDRDRIPIMQDPLENILIDQGLETLTLDYQSETKDAPHHIEFPQLPFSQNESAFFQELIPLPDYTGVFGFCQDGQPLLLDLTDPTPGSILILGDQNSGISALFRIFLNSIIFFNQPDEVNILILSDRSHGYSLMFDSVHYIDNISVYERQAYSYVLSLTEIAEQRRYGRQLGPILILAIDDLASLLQYNEFEINNHLRWLVKHGPGSGVWVVSNLPTRGFDVVDPKILNNFGTYLLGRLSFPPNMRNLPAAVISHARELMPGYEFIAHNNRSNIQFYLPT